MTVKVRVANSGRIDGDEVSQVYLTSPPAEGAPVRELVGFMLTHVPAGQCREVFIAVNARAMS